MADEVQYSPEDRWARLKLLQEHYVNFNDFLYDVMTDLLGFDCTDIQLDIAAFLEHGPLYRMIQAQRGQAKTTITAGYAVWRLIHNPSARILVISSGSPMAKEIANWVIQIIEGMECLDILRAGGDDRQSVEAYDVHRDLKGPEKSPSIACIGITANMQGKRADVLIADDIESSKNSQTEVQRERLKHLSKDFSSICATGDIIYLGTPQSIDSIYNGLVSRGYSIRIWPGRYPTADELDNYGTHLAPVIANRMKADPTLQIGGGPLGMRGQPTDPIMMSEEVLSKKEMDQGAAYFQLQHMLDTRLSDAARFPLKPSNIVFTKFGSKTAPVAWNIAHTPDNRLYTPNDWPVEVALHRASGHSHEFIDFESQIMMYLDPAGGGANGDETAWAITRFAGNSVYVLAIGAAPGGVHPDNLKIIAKAITDNKVNYVAVEKNFGNGIFAAVLREHLQKVKYNIAIEDVWESGQKELRIIDVLEPVINSGRLVMDEDLVKEDWQVCSMHAIADRPSYSLFYQMSRITRERGALLHDDRVDALAGAVRHWHEHLHKDVHQAVASASAQRYRDMIENPFADAHLRDLHNRSKGVNYRLGHSVSGALHKMRGRI